MECRSDQIQERPQKPTWGSESFAWRCPAERISCKYNNSQMQLLRWISVIFICATCRDYVSGINLPGQSFKLLRNFKSGSANAFLSHLSWEKLFPCTAKSWPATASKWPRPKSMDWFCCKNQKPWRSMKYMDFLCFPADVPFQLKKYSLVIFPMIPTLAMAFKKGWEAVQLQTPGDGGDFSPQKLGIYDLSNRLKGTSNGYFKGMHLGF